MRKPFAVFLLFVFVLAAYPLCAQSVPAPQQAGKAGRTKTFSGTIRRISATKIWLADKKKHITAVYSFSITKETIVEGEPVVGKTADVEYTSKEIKKKEGSNSTRKTAVKIKTQ